MKRTPPKTNNKKADSSSWVLVPSGTNQVNEGRTQLSKRDASRGGTSSVAALKGMMAMMYVIWFILMANSLFHISSSSPPSTGSSSPLDPAIYTRSGTRSQRQKSRPNSLSTKKAANQDLFDTEVSQNTATKKVASIVDKIPPAASTVPESTPTLVPQVLQTGQSKPPTELAIKSDENAMIQATPDKTEQNSNKQPLLKSLTPQSSSNKDPPKIAYAFFLGGIPPIDDSQYRYVPAMRRANTTKSRLDDYRGLLYNILVSVKILQDSGSRADFVLLVQMADDTNGTAELPATDIQWLTALNIHILYVPPLPNLVNEFSTIAFEKFRILDLIKYDRVLYLDADITPRCNLDYLMEWSLKGILQPNVIVSMEHTPASSKLFVLSPAPGEFLRLVNLIPDRTTDIGVRGGWKDKVGWGYNHTAKWNAVGNGQQGKHYGYEGGNSDQGLLLEWTKYMKKSVSIIVGNQTENWFDAEDEVANYSNETIQKIGRRLETWEDEKAHHYIVNKPLVNNSLLKYTCFPAAEQEESVTFMNQSLRGIAPYCDIEQWQLTTSYPWNLKKIPSSESMYRGYEKWFHVLRQLDEQLQMGLGLQNNIRSDDTSDATTWNYIPKISRIRFNPMWSAGVKALVQWGYRIADTSEGHMTWEPPIVTERLSTNHNDKSSGQATAKGIRDKCQCPEYITTDPCSSSNETIEDWLSRRVPYYLSKQRPLCPRAARHKMHVVVPFHNLTQESLQSIVCSVACQNYPPDKVAIHVYDDGSPTDALDAICDKEDTIEFEPAEGFRARTSTAKVNTGSSSWGLVQRFLERAKTESSKTKPICIKSTKYLGATGANYWAYRFVEKFAEPNDIVVVADEGEFITRNALEVINDKYVSMRAMTTYGGATEEHRSEALPEDIAQGTARFRPRMEKPSWRFGRPYTFKVHLLGKTGFEDFTYKDGSWLVGNRGFIYRILELAGVERIGHISQPIFEQRKVKNLVSTSVEHLQHVKSLVESKKIGIPFHMVMICAKDVELLKHQLVWLQEQTITKKRQIILHLLCHEALAEDQVGKSVAKFLQIQRASKRKGLIPIQIVVVGRPDTDTINDFSRFKYLQELQRRTPLESAILLDNDQYWPPSYMNALMQFHRPRTMLSWFGKTYSKLGEVFNADFDSSDLQLEHLLILAREETKTFVYSGHGGAIFDANLLWFDQQLYRLQDDMKQHIDASDVWVSFVLDALLGWEMRRIGEKEFPVFISYLHVASYRNAIEQELPNAPIKILSSFSRRDLEIPYPVIGTGNSYKQRVFAELQRKFHWNVVRRHDLPMRIPGIKLAPLQYGISPEISSSTEDGAEDKKQQRVFICVTGQFSRFELEKKIENIFKPMQKAGFELDVALVVSNGTAVFTNAKTKKSNIPFFTRFEDAVQMLQDSNMNVVSQNGAYPIMADPQVPELYVRLLKYNQEGRSYEQQKARAKNHARIFDSYRRCLQYADRAAEKANFRASEKTPHYYDFFVRIRDDVGMKKEIKESVLADVLPPPPNSIIVTECRSWNGMNDRFAIVSPDIARSYFERPYELFSLNGRIYDKGAVRNPESLLLYVYSNARHHVLGHPSLNGLFRMYKTSDNTTKILRDDIAGERCPEPDPYRQRFEELFGWAV